jgi:hypothetical protein
MTRQSSPVDRQFKQSPVRGLLEESQPGPHLGQWLEKPTGLGNMMWVPREELNPTLMYGGQVTWLPSHSPILHFSKLTRVKAPIQSAPVIQLIFLKILDL